MLSHSSCAPCAERQTSVTTLKSGKTRTVSWSFSWHNVLWLPFKIEVRLESEARKRPVEEGCVSFTPGDRCPGWTGGALEITSVIAAASEFLLSPISLSQSDFPVEIIILRFPKIVWNKWLHVWRKTNLSVVRFDWAQHLCVHVYIEATRIDVVTWSRVTAVSSSKCLSDNVVPTEVTRIDAWSAISSCEGNIQCTESFTYRILLLS